MVDWLDRLARDALQPIRDEVDWPIIVRSGYRSESLNRMIPGASKTSQHVLGQAADIQAAPGLVKARPGSGAAGLRAAVASDGPRCSGCAVA